MAKRTRDLNVISPRSSRPYTYHGEVAIRAAVVPHAERVRPFDRHVVEIVQGDGVPFASQARRESAAESVGQQHPRHQQR